MRELDIGRQNERKQVNESILLIWIISLYLNKNPLLYNEIITTDKTFEKNGIVFVKFITHTCHIIG